MGIELKVTTDGTGTRSVSRIILEWKKVDDSIFNKEFAVINKSPNSNCQTSSIAHFEDLIKLFNIWELIYLIKSCFNTHQLLLDITEDTYEYYLKDKDLEDIREVINESYRNQTGSKMRLILFNFATYRLSGVAEKIGNTDRLDVLKDISRRYCSGVNHKELVYNL